MSPSPSGRNPTDVEVRKPSAADLGAPPPRLSRLPAGPRPASGPRRLAAIYRLRPRRSPGRAAQLRSPAAPPSPLLRTKVQSFIAGCALNVNGMYTRHAMLVIDLR